MIIRTRATTKTKTKNMSFPPIAIVAIVALLSLSSSSTFFFDTIQVLLVQSFSTTTPTSLSSRRQLVVVASSNDRDDGRDVQKKFSPKPGTEGSKRRNTKTKTNGHNNNNNNNNRSRQTNSSNTNKTYKDRQEQQQRERERRELHNKLHRARDSILYYGQDLNNDIGQPPSAELRSGILMNLVQSYTSAIIQASSPTSSSNNNAADAVLKLEDLWDLRHVILTESRPVQERILGLLAVFIQATTHIEEEYNDYYNSNEYGVGKKKKTTPYSMKKATDHIRFVRSRLWKTCREVLSDMATAEDAPHIVSPIAVTALAKSLRESSTKSKISPDSSSNNNGDGKNVNDNDCDYGSGVVEIKELMQLVNDARVAAAASTPNKIDDDNKKTRNDGDDDNLDRALLVAWNFYLSSLCDRALVTKNPSDAGLGIAADLLIGQQQSDAENIIVSSDIASYNTVLNIAAKAGNATLVDTLWQDLTEKRKQQQTTQASLEKISLSLQPNSRTYNTRLMVTNDPKQRLEIFDQEIIPTAFRFHRENVTATNTAAMSVIDSFTIDLVLMPLLQANRKKHLFQLIDHWMTIMNRQHNGPQDQRQQRRKNDNNKAQRAFKNALSAFFITLVQRNGDVRTARELWNRYMVLEIDNNDGNDHGIHADAFLRSTNIVYPERRHYNILLDGYARLVDQVRDRQGPDFGAENDDSDTKKPIRTTKIWEVPNDDDDDDRNLIATSEYFQEVQEKAIHDGQELFALMMAQQQHQNSRNTVGPDAYTKSTMVRLCRSGSEVQNLLERASDATATAATSSKKTGRTWLPRAVIRAAVTTCGRLGDPSIACMVFDQYMFPDEGDDGRRNLSNYRAFNVLLGALAAGAKMENPKLEVNPTIAGGDEQTTKPSFFLSQVNGLTCTEAVICILNLMTSKNSQTYCVAASALQYAPIDETMRLSGDNDNDAKDTPMALQIFQNATRAGIQADGRLVNAIFRCYGDDIAGALDGWKLHIRTATNQYENRSRRFDKLKASNNPATAAKKKNMLAAYNGLLYVCGRAERPDIAVRIVYAMKNKEGLDPSENPYNNYRSGKSTRQNLVSRDEEQSSWRGIVAKRLPKIDMVGQYENILYVECKKYDTRDRRMENDKRVRIIV